jgi:hypothetical protein
MSKKFSFLQTILNSIENGAYDQLIQITNCEYMLANSQNQSALSKWVSVFLKSWYPLAKFCNLRTFCFSTLVYWGSVTASEPTCICANHLTCLISHFILSIITICTKPHTWLACETAIIIITTDWWTLNYVQHSSCVWYYSEQNFMHNTSPQVYYILTACIYLLNVPHTLIN